MFVSFGVDLGPDQAAIDFNALFWKKIKSD